MRYAITIGIGFVFTFISCKTVKVNFTHPSERIVTLPGPEDMVLDTLGEDERIIISCASRRKTESFVSGIQFYQFKTESITTAPITGLPDSIRFRPHGMDMGLFRGNKILWVINHEDEKKRQSVLRFIIQGDTLVFDSIITHPFIVSPNDICDGGNGSFYLTNDASSRKSTFELLFKIKGGSVVYFDSNGGFQKFKRGFAYPNGIIKVDHHLYISTTRENKIFSIGLDAEGNLLKDSVILVTKGKGWDNFSRFGDRLLCTSHIQPIKFLGHLKKSSNLSPCRVYSIHPLTKSKGMVYHTDGIDISAASTAIFYKDHLYISQVFDSFILDVNLHNY